MSIQVRERGVQLSGGQKQRIAIAHAILLDPLVLYAHKTFIIAVGGFDTVRRKSLERCWFSLDRLILVQRKPNIEKVNP